MRLFDCYQPAPTDMLMSMDVFMTGYRKAQKLADDKIALERLALTYQWRHHFNFAEQLFEKGSIVLVTTPQMKIVFASSSITGMSGYTPAELVGQKPNILQGESTNASSRANIRMAVEECNSFNETLINYRKDGSLYRCRIMGYPVFNRNKEVVNFIAFEKELAMVG